MEKAKHEHLWEYKVGKSGEYIFLLRKCVCGVKYESNAIDEPEWFKLGKFGLREDNPKEVK